MNIAEILRTHAATGPDAEAIVDVISGNRRSMSFGELDKASAQAAAMLQQAGLKPGDAVLVFQPMSQELYIALLAIFRSGLIAMFLDPSAGRKHIEQCCQLQAPKALIASAKAHLLRLLSPALRRIPIKFSVGWPMPGAIPWQRVQYVQPLWELISCSPETPALLTFTSGSTGQPKAALRTHGFLLAQHRALEANLHLQPGSKDLTTLPIFVLSNLASGVTSVIPDADLRFPGKIVPAPVLSQIETEKPVSVGASPALLERLANGCGSFPDTMRSFDKIFTGGAPVFPGLLKQLHCVAPQAEIVAVYGSTEVEPIAHITLQEITTDDFAAMVAGRGLLAGTPVSELELCIMGEQWGQSVGPFTQNEFQEACCPSNGIGEIVVSGDHVLHGYLHRRGDEETKFNVNGVRWHRTGDAGYLDEQGRLWLLGRCSARIDDEWGILYPFTVECAANGSQGIRRAVVLSRHGQRVLAVELKDKEDRASLNNLLFSLSWAKISAFCLLDHIPVDKRHNAKVDYPALEALIQKKQVVPILQKGA